MHYCKLKFVWIYPFLLFVVASHLTLFDYNLKLYIWHHFYVLLLLQLFSFIFLPYLGSGTLVFTFKYSFYDQWQHMHLCSIKSNFQISIIFQMLMFLTQVFSIFNDFLLFSIFQLLTLSLNFKVSKDNFKWNKFLVI